jgi:hypothetical protein
MSECAPKPSANLSGEEAEEDDEEWALQKARAKLAQKLNAQNANYSSSLAKSPWPRTVWRLAKATRARFWSDPVPILSAGPKARGNC